MDKNRLSSSSVSQIVMWCALPLLLMCRLATAAPLPVVVAEPFVELRTGPAVEYPVFYVAEKGETIQVLKSRTGWYKVLTRKGQEGWISASALNQTLHTDGEIVNVGSGTFEDYQQRDWEMGIAIGLLEDVTAMSVSASWVATENFVVQGSYTQALGDFAENKYWAIRLQHYTFPEWQLSPYFSIGTGQLRTVPRSNLVESGDESRTSDIMEVGGGLRYYLSGNMVMRLEYKSLLALTQRDEQEELEEWTLGITVFF